MGYGGSLLLAYVVLFARCSMTHSLFCLFCIELQQLFNLTNDPLEEQDEINNPLYAEVLKEMRERHNVLREWVK